MKPGEDEGRISGDTEWKRARGELGDRPGVDANDETCATTIETILPRIGTAYLVVLLPAHSEAESAYPAVFSHKDFRQDQPFLSKIGDATHHDNRIRLTSARASQRGALWTKYACYELKSH